MNKSLIKKYLAGLISVLIFFTSGGSFYVYAENEENGQRALSEYVQKKITSGARFVLGIKDKIQDTNEELVLLRKNTNELEESLTITRANIQNLETQLDNIGQLIEQNQKRRRAVALLIAQTKNATVVLQDNLRQREQLLEAYKNKLAPLLSAISIAQRTQITETLASVLAAGDIATATQQEEYLYFLREEANALADDLIREQVRASETRDIIEEKREAMLELSTVLTAEERMLSESAQAKKRLLQETQGKQEVYEELLAISRQDIVSVSAEVQRLRENFTFFQEKLDELQEKVARGESIGDTSYPENGTDPTIALFASELKPLAWPVSPSRGLTAFFRDIEYEKTLGVRHNAVDIRAAQGTKLQAAADGVVTKTVDGGLGYSYIMIAHQGKLMTLYGHVSEIFVKEGQLVKQGQVIGLTGGMPGTRGSGWLTTGPHLHLEVFENFKYVDPLYYLPLEYVPAKSLPEEYLQLLLLEKKQ